MASVQKSIENASAQLRNLTISQRLAVLFGAILVAGSLVWMAQWAATPEMVALLDQPMSAADIAQVRSGLLAMNEPHEVNGARVLVRADANRAALLAQLGQMDRMPSDTSLGFAELIKDANPWLPQEENNKRWMVALTTELQKVLGQLNGVKSAKVFLNLNPGRSGFSKTASESTASVLLVTKSSESVSRQLALAAARLVAGAVRGLPLRNVEVVDGGGRSALNWEDEGADSGQGLQQLQKQVERETAEKITEQLSFDRNVRVSVQAVLDRAARTENLKTPVEGVAIEENKTEQRTSRGKPTQQAGVEANTGAVAAGASNEGEFTENTTDKKISQPGMSETTTTNPAGSVKQVFAAISISYSYLEGVFRRKNPDGKAPSEADIQKVFDEQKQRIENQVAKLVLPPDSKQVAVEWYYDAAVLESTPAAAASAFDSGMEIAQRYGPPSALGLVAIFALAMVMRMAKHKDSGEAFGMEIGLSQEAIEAARRAADDLGVEVGARARNAPPGARGVGGGVGGGGGVTYTENGVVITKGAADDGSVAEVLPVPMGMMAEGVLEAQEVDDATVQIHNMIDQINQMTKADEEAMAQLVEKWVDQIR